MMDSSPAEQSRVAVTGVGLVTPFGETCEATWSALVRGDRAVRRLSADDFGLQRFPDQPGWGPWNGAPAAGPPLRPLAPEADDPIVDLARRATAAALYQARITRGGVDAARIGCVFGTSKGGLDAYAALSRNPASATSLWSVVPSHVPCARLCADYGWGGPALVPVAACATGLVSLIRGAQLLRDDECDVVLAGSSDASLQPGVLASFRRLGVLAAVDDDPGRSVRPFDARRTGFAVGEGAGVLVLERWNHAIARGVPILAEWVDGLARCDPHGLTLLPDDPAALVRLLRDLLRRAGLQPADIDGIALHGTGTRMNDAYEARAIAEIWGRDPRQLCGFGIKGAIGHLLGAAGSVEAAVAVCALLNQQLPPTVNCEMPAADCPVPLTIGSAVHRSQTHLLKISLGFGGHLAAGLLRRGPVGFPAANLCDSAETV